MRRIAFPFAFALLAVPATVAAQEQPDLAGLYDGSQLELVAYLGLAPEGRFRFALSTGALDLEGEGTWEQDGGCAILQSEPFEKPRFELARSEPLAPGRLELSLTVAGGGDPQYFDYALTFPDGTSDGGQMREEGILLEYSPGEAPERAAILFPLFNLSSDPVAIPRGEGRRLSFSFESNDLTMVEFAGTRACLEDGELILPVWDEPLPMRRVEGE